MESVSGRYVISYNGEVYNYREIRAELVNAGHVFQSDSDTEVILAAFAHWGVDSFDRLNGMFAFALYDKEHRRLFLVRDRLGVKPLYYAELYNGALIFASELKALCAHPLLAKTVDPQAIDAYFAFGYVPDHLCFFQNVKKLPAGHYCVAEQGKGMTKPVKWWDVDFSKRSERKESDLEEEFRALLRSAVDMRMVSDVPLGAFLSGGLDSSSVVAMMAGQSKEAVTACSIGFDVAGYDESSYATQIADRFACRHVLEKVAPVELEEISEIAGYYDEPFADASMVPMAVLCGITRQHVTVALSGDGADEAFAGYRRHVFQHGEEKMRSILPQSLREPVFGFAGKYYPKADWLPRFMRAKSTLLGLAKSGAESYADSVGVSNMAMRNSLYSEKFASTLQGYIAEEYWLDMMADAPARSGLDAAQYADLKIWLPGDILTKTDRASMAKSLEAREPLLDYRLVEFAARLPDHMRVRRGKGKYLMKKAMAEHLPENIIWRPKMGFVLPIAHWFRHELADHARHIARSSHLANSGWFNVTALEQLAEDHIAGRRDVARQLWQLWMLDLALARFS